MAFDNGINFTIRDMSGPAKPTLGFFSKYDFLCIDCYNKYIKKIVETVANELNFEVD